MRECFLPIDKSDLKKRGWDRADFIIVSGDAYVDHPSFGAAVIGRLLEREGFRVGMICQPDWQQLDDFKRLGRPALAFLVTGGNIDSMVNHYTAAKKRRKSDAYSPGGKTGLRPDRATIVYSQKLKEAYKKVPVIIGGLEASLRRLSHYDYWDNRVRRSILLDSKADILVYGMGERQITEIAAAMKNGIRLKDITFVRGTVYKREDIDEDSIGSSLLLPHYDEVSSSPEAFARSFMSQYRNSDPVSGLTLVEPYRHHYVIQNPPAEPFSSAELDDIYRISFTKDYHPVYEKNGGIPAIEEVRHSLVSSRGCFGSCNFCSLSFHQGRIVQARSIPALLDDARELIKRDDFKGYINDVGGPTANFRHSACERQAIKGSCPDKKCLSPAPCKNLKVEHREYLQLLRDLRSLKGVKKVFIRSGIRFDYLMYDKDDTFFRELCKHHISGQLKVAPEHVVPGVLDKMGKPGPKVFEEFIRKFEEINKKNNMEQYLVFYLISGHPGSDLNAAIRLAEYLRDKKSSPEQVQDFYPTPGTISTCMYYTGLDPLTMKTVYVPRSPREKAQQRALIQYKNPKNYSLVKEALLKAGRPDLIGTGKKCLIKERSIKKDIKKNIKKKRR